MSNSYVHVPFEDFVDGSVTQIVALARGPRYYDQQRASLTSMGATTNRRELCGTPRLFYVDLGGPERWDLGHEVEGIA